MDSPEIVPPDAMMAEIVAQAEVDARAAAILAVVTLTDSEDAALVVGVQAGVNRALQWLLDHGYIGGREAS